jgi:hypothetical protein
MNRSSWISIVYLRVCALGSRHPAADDILQAKRYAVSGTITKDTKFIEASGVLGAFDMEEEAELAASHEAHTRVDSHG